MGSLQQEEIIRARAATPQQASYVARFHVTHAGWKDSGEDVLLRLLHGHEEGFLVIWKDVAVASVAIVGDCPRGRVGMVGNVVVGQEHRRQGMGTRLLQRALHISRQEGLCEVYLLATPEGRLLYENKLGFSLLGEWSAVHLELSAKDSKRYLEDGVGGCAGSARLCEGGVDSHEFGQAIELDKSVVPWRTARSGVLRKIVEQGGKCVVVMGSGKALGMAMGRMKDLGGQNHLLFLGPVIAENVRMVRDLFLCLMREFRKEFKKGFAVHVVAFQKLDADGEGVSGMFENLGFIEVIPYAFMVKRLSGSDGVQEEPKLYARELHSKYFAVVDYDFG